MLRKVGRCMRRSVGGSVARRVRRAAEREAERRRRRGERAERAALNGDDPRVLERLRGGEPLGGPLAHELLEQIDRVRRHSLPPAAVERERRLDNGLARLGERPMAVALKRSAPAEQSVERRAEGPQVNRRVVGGGGAAVRTRYEQLGRHVAERAHALRHRLALEYAARKTKVDQLGLRVRVAALKHDVLRLDVSVDDAALVHVEDSGQEAGGNARDALLVEPVGRAQHLVDERAARAQLEHHPHARRRRFLERLIHAHDIRVVQRALQLELLPQLCESLVAIRVDRLESKKFTSRSLSEYLKVATTTAT
mmetsp:Transcript_27069/g.56858  ORF Transcript_27069/g.56858 Transcript_27069/m.56858 type:complete len:310 (-) Transcript_27069:676-1605(-)